MSDTPPPSPPPARRRVPSARGPILGRVTDAVREQNWFAVVLELAIVVLGELLHAHAESIAELAALQSEARTHEHAVSEAVLDAYGLTPEERALVWATAPPRMPLDPP